MALIHSSFENQILDKHVESVLLPRLDRGSTPRSSTAIFNALIFSILRALFVFYFLKNVFFRVSVQFGVFGGSFRHTVMIRKKLFRSPYHYDNGGDLSKPWWIELGVLRYAIRKNGAKALYGRFCGA